MEEPEIWNSKYLPIPLEYAVQVARMSNIANSLLSRVMESSKYIVNVGYLKYACDRLPLPALGLDIYLEVYSVDIAGNKTSYVLQLDSERIEISHVEWITGDFGSDSVVKTVFESEKSGYMNDGGDPLRCSEALDSWVSDVIEIASDENWSIELNCDLHDFIWADRLQSSDDDWDEMPSYFC